MATSGTGVKTGDTTAAGRCLVASAEKDGVKLSDFESALIGRIMVLRARGEFVIPETLLSALDDAVV